MVPAACIGAGVLRTMPVAKAPELAPVTNPRIVDKRLFESDPGFGWLSTLGDERF